MGLIVALLGAACAGAPKTPPAPAAPAVVQVVAVGMNQSGALPPSSTLAWGSNGTRCADSSDIKVLNPIQVSVLEGILAESSTWGGDEAKCTLPLHGFAWLDAEGRPVRQIAVSLLCDKVEGAPAVPGQPSDPARRGLSEDGKVAFRALCVDLGLPHCHITSPEEAFGR